MSITAYTDPGQSNTTEVLEEFRRTLSRYADFQLNALSLINLVKIVKQMLRICSFWSCKSDFPTPIRTRARRETIAQRDEAVSKRNDAKYSKYFSNRQEFFQHKEPSNKSYFIWLQGSKWPRVVLARSRFHTINQLPPLLLLPVFATFASPLGYLSICFLSIRCLFQPTFYHAHSGTKKRRQSVVSRTLSAVLRLTPVLLLPNKNHHNIKILVRGEYR